MSIVETSANSRHRDSSFDQVLFDLGCEVEESTDEGLEKQTGAMNHGQGENLQIWHLLFRP
jgi:hypothetical protein